MKPDGRSDRRALVGARGTGPRASQPSREEARDAYNEEARALGAASALRVRLAGTLSAAKGVPAALQACEWKAKT